MTLKESRAIDACVRELVPLGFVDRGDGILLREGSGGVSEWLGLAASLNVQPGAVAVNPVVGVRDENIEQVVRDIISADVQFVTSTIVIPVAELNPTLLPYSWIFADGDFESTARDLVRLVEAYGFPWMGAHSSTASIADVLKRKNRTLDESERLAIAYGIIGDIGAMEAVLLGLLSAEPEFELEFVAKMRSRFSV
ncbi:MAG: hypothetical protein ABIS86_11350 [Streptosporangiaceae bacterium]